MTGLEIVNCEVGTIRSRKDHSCVFSVETPELRVSEAGLLMQWHGRACAVTIKPQDTPPDELVRVDTERAVKTPSQRLRSVLYVAHQQGVDVRQGENFANYYDRIVDGFVERVKGRLS